MDARVTMAVALLVVATSLVGPTALASSSTDSTTSNMFAHANWLPDVDRDSSCKQEVKHTAFRATEAIETVNKTGEATSTVDNTHVRVEDVTGFIRLHASNPNGYCVRLIVTIAPEIVPPADLGEVDSVNETSTASWRTHQNLSSGAVYTHIELTLEPGANATFAPSKARVKSLSWTGKAKETGGGILSKVTSLWGNDKLEKRTYTIEPSNGSDSITIPLEQDGQRIEEWQATYTFKGETRGVTQDADKPVFFTESEDSVTFHFNNESAEVTFTAEPTLVDKARYRGSSYISGLKELGGWLPFTSTPVPASRRVVT